MAFYFFLKRIVICHMSTQKRSRLLLEKKEPSRNHTPTNSHTQLRFWLQYERAPRIPTQLYRGDINWKKKLHHTLFFHVLKKSKYFSNSPTGIDWMGGEKKLIEQSRGERKTRS